MWRKNILGEGKFLVGPGLKVQKQKEGYDCRKARGASSMCIYDQAGEAGLGLTSAGCFLVTRGRCFDFTLSSVRHFWTDI